MSTYAKFSKDLRKELNTKVVKTLDNAMAEAGIKGHAIATMGTPIDTGRLSSAWRLTKDQRSRSEPTDRNKPIGHIKGNHLYIAEQNEATSSAARVAKTFDSKKHKHLFLTNNMVYASTINDQFGMMENALSAMDSILGRRLK